MQDNVKPRPKDTRMTRGLMHLHGGSKRANSSEREERRERGKEEGVELKVQMTTKKEI